MTRRFALGTEPCNLAALVDSRLLVQANSGGGKSWCLRRLLEQTHGAVQHLVLDPEGEFSSLRERFDYVLAARSGGDCVADPRSAKLLAERLLELGVSAIIDLYELKAHERVRFVRLFVEALVEAPKSLWHPALVVIDEAHVFAPQAGEAESLGAVIDLSTRGRKRGFCAVLATQRLSKLHKDAAAECNNVLIGRTGLDVDMKRAADTLGLSGRDDVHRLRTLDPGEFFAFGPAFQPGVTRIRIGEVATTHPKAGSRIAFTAPPPTAAVRAMLPKLADLPAEAEERAKTVDDLKRELADTRRRLTLAERAAPEPVVTRVEVPVVTDAEWGALADLETSARAATAAVEKLNRDVHDRLDKLSGVPLSQPEMRQAARPRIPAAVAPRPASSTPTPRAAIETGQRILNALAELEALGGAAPQRTLVGLFVNYTNIQSKGFRDAVAALAEAGMVEFPDAGRVALTDLGRRNAEPPPRPRTTEEFQSRIVELLGGKSGTILGILIRNYPRALDRTDLGAAAGFTNIQSKGFRDAVSQMTQLGFVEAGGGTVKASSMLFLDGRRS